MEHSQSQIVVMGDLVRSERAPGPAALHQLFNAAIDTQNHACAGDILSPLTITLGDEFQGIVRNWSTALRILRAIRLHLMRGGVDCRFVAGLVDLKTPVNPDRAWNMMGPGLGHARDKLNEKRDVSLYRFAIPHNPLAEATLDALGAGVTLIERGWSDRQRDDIAALMQGHSAADLAHARQVSVHSIYKVRAAGHFETYQIQWQAISALLDQTNTRTGGV